MTKIEYGYSIAIQAIVVCIAWGIVGHYSSNNINGVLCGIVLLSVNFGYGCGRLASIKE